MSKLIEKLEWVAEWGGTKKDIVYLILSGISLLLSIFGVPMPVNPAWVAIILQRTKSQTNSAFATYMPVVCRRISSITSGNHKKKNSRFA